MGGSKNQFQGSCNNFPGILSAVLWQGFAPYSWAQSSCFFLFLLARPARAQIARRCHCLSKSSSSSSATIASPRFSTAGPNELLLAFVAADYISGTNTTVKSIAGGSLTWTLVRRTNAQSGTSEMWKAFAATPLAGAATVTATLSQSVAVSITVRSSPELAPPEPTAPARSAPSGGASAGKRGAPSASLVTTGVGSWVWPSATTLTLRQRGPSVQARPWCTST